MRRSMGVVVMLGALVLGGCGGPKIDASSEAAFKKSVEDVKKPLDDTKKKKFDAAVATIMFSRVLTTAGDEKAMEAKMKEIFDGKTADDIISEADKIEAEGKKAK